MHQFRIYVGPTLVKPIARLLCDAGFFVKLEGTAHVYVEAESESEILAALPNWSIRDISKAGSL